MDKWYPASQPFQRRRGRRGTTAGPVAEAGQDGTVEAGEPSPDAAGMAEVPDMAGGQDV